ISADTDRRVLSRSLERSLGSDLRVAEFFANPAIFSGRSSGGANFRYFRREIIDLFGSREYYFPKKCRGARLFFRLFRATADHRSAFFGRARGEDRAMRAVALAACALCACEPAFDETAYLVTAPRVLAVRGEPAEDLPGRAIEYSALV